ncbi:MAG: hypothetical protein M1827_006863 [Pycnora praestabilis]|nr:MAG: hypothetical protein M1827_006863 [Pycnora praestabilis]
MQQRNGQVNGQNPTRHDEGGGGSPEEGSRHEQGKENEALAKDRQARHPFRTAIRNFSPVWFTISMDTGIISIIMNRLPYQFSGLPVLSTIVFVFNLVLFSIFMTISILRLIMYPRHIYNSIASNVEQLSLLAAPAIAFLTIVSQIGMICSTAWHHGFTLVAYVLWWIGMAWTVITCTFVYIRLMMGGMIVDRALPANVFLPIIGLMTSASIGGLLINYSYDVSPRLAVPVIVVGYLCNGYAIFLTLIMYAIYLHGLLIGGWPAPAKAPSLYLLIGPMGQSATALQLLGSAADTKMDFVGYNEGTFLRASGTPGMDSSSVLIALLLLGLGFLWICVAYYAMIELLVTKQLKFSMIWWSMIFPMGE